MIAVYLLRRTGAGEVAMACAVSRFLKEPAILGLTFTGELLAPWDLQLVCDDIQSLPVPSLPEWQNFRSLEHPLIGSGKGTCDIEGPVGYSQTDTVTQYYRGSVQCRRNCR